MPERELVEHPNYHLEDTEDCDVDHTATSILAGVRAGSFG